MGCTKHIGGPRAPNLEEGVTKSANGRPWLQVTREDCDLLQEAVKRYYRVIVQTLGSDVQKWTSRRFGDKTWKKDPEFKAYLDSLEIQLMAPCEKLPYLHMDEHCKYDWTLDG